MKSLTILAVCVCLSAVSLPAWAQAANGTAAATTHGRGILGYLDPQTGAFRPKRTQVSAPVDSTTVSITQGTFVVGLTVNVISSFPSGETYICSAISEVFEETSGLDFIDTASVAGTRSGNTVTCTVMIPYYWPLATPSQDTVNVSFSVIATGPASANGQPTRETDQTIVASYPVPAQFKTTTFNLGAVL